MADHEMVPSEVEGFHMQCKHCKALDTEIRFALGNECPNAPDRQEQGAIPVIQFIEPTPVQRALLIQAEWMTGYFNRQFSKTLQK
ncbi:hypothetical protein ACQKO5_19265 [Novosphingobium subterraneum]|uniref:hypothetical protein n=1 Tax=Novosphingobium subterraneum TaxID=48936 RepID=UPI003D0791DA